MHHFSTTRRLLRILLVEDEPADAHLIRLAFEANALPVDLAHVRDGIDALCYLRQEGSYAQASAPDLILLDLNMPRMDGKTLLKALKADHQLRSIPVVVLTTSEAESDIVASYALCAAGFMVKPLEVDDFIRQIGMLEHYWHEIMRLPSEGS